MAFYARDEYVATAGQTNFVFSFAYISEDHIFAFVNGVLEPDWTLTGASTLKFDVGLSEGDDVVILRNTSYATRLVDWVAGTVITEADMDTDSLQGFFMAQEAVDTASVSGLPYGVDNQYTAGSKNIRDLALPTEGGDAVTKDYVDALTIAAGNVPIPDNPGEDGLTLVASGGAWDWHGLAPSALDATPDVITLLSCADNEAMQRALGLGTAALTDTGVAEGDVPELQAGGVMPAVGLGAMTGISAWVPLESGDITGGSLDIEPADLDTYKMIKLIVVGIKTADAADADILMRWKLDGAYKTGVADYGWYCEVSLVGTGSYDAYDNSDSTIKLVDIFNVDDIFSAAYVFTNTSLIVAGTYPMMSLDWCQMMRVTGATKYVMLSYRGDGGAFHSFPIEGIRLYKSAGTFNAGKYYIYGMNSLT